MGHDPAKGPCMLLSPGVALTFRLHCIQLLLIMLLSATIQLGSIAENIGGEIEGPPGTASNRGVPAFHDRPGSLGISHCAVTALPSNELTTVKFLRKS